MKAFVLMFALAACYCQGLPDADTTITYQAGTGGRLPIVISQTSPLYSEEGYKHKYQTIVKLSMVIGLDGKTEDIKVIEGAGLLGLDERAVEAVSAWRFRPGMMGGRPFRVAAHVEINYRLRRWRIVSTDYRTAPDASEPVATRRWLANAGKSCGPTTLALHIGTDGVPSDVRVVQTTPESINAKLIESMRMWRFKASLQNGLPVDATAAVTLDCEPWPASGN
ncbi:MAG: TonB family protein [Acidobacteria bacterium]|nr:TonB family protein [Acidobacteriota bacterium]